MLLQPGLEIYSRALFGISEHLIPESREDILIHILRTQHFRKSGKLPLNTTRRRSTGVKAAQLTKPRHK